MKTDTNLAVINDLESMTYSQINVTTQNQLTSGQLANNYSVSGYNWTPYIQTWPYTYTVPEHFDVQVRKVENGWIVKKHGKEYVLTKAEQIVKYLTEEKK